MGTFGTGIFDNDAANDYYAEFLESVCDEIDDIVREPDNLWWDEPLLANFTVKLKVLLVLRQNIGKSAYPSLTSIKHWRKHFTDVWSQFDEPFMLERKKIILEVFDDLESSAPPEIAEDMSSPASPVNDNDDNEDLLKSVFGEE